MSKKKKISIKNFKEGKVKKFGEIEVLNPSHKDNFGVLSSYTSEIGKITEEKLDKKEHSEKLVGVMLKYFFINLDTEDLTDGELANIIDSSSVDLQEAFTYISDKIVLAISNMFNTNKKINKINKEIESNEKISEEDKKKLKIEIGNNMKEKEVLKNERKEELKKEIIEKEKKRDGYEKTLKALKSTDNKEMIKSCEVEIDILLEELSILNRQLDEL